MKAGQCTARHGDATAMPRTIEERNEHITQFIRDNQNDLKRFMSFKTGIIDDNIVRDCLQDFYHRVVKSDTLNTFNPEKGRFDTFICSCFSNIMTTAGKKNERVRRRHFSLTLTKDGPIDIFSKVGGEIQILPTYVTSQLRHQEDTDIQQDIEGFLCYLDGKVSEEEHKRVTLFMEHRYAGCMDRDLVIMFKLSNQKFRAFKKRVRVMYLAYCEGVRIEEDEAEQG